MPRHDAYLLHIYRSRTLSGWQWAARLDHLPGRESLRFSDRSAAMDYLHRVVYARDDLEPSSEPPGLAGRETPDQGEGLG